jgi:hypothetical protein
LLPTLSLANAITAMMTDLNQWRRDALANVKSAIALADPHANVSGDQILFHFLPVVMANGVQPIGNLWSGQMLKRAQLELNREIARFADGKSVTEAHCLELQELLAEYMAVWLSWRPGVRNIPYDETIARALSRLNVGSKRVGDIVVMDPLLIMMVSDTVTTFPGMFWKNIKQQFTLT